VITHGHSIGPDLLRLSLLLTVAIVSITVVLPQLLLLAAAAGR
jgi:hypothetical protein